MGRAFGMEQLLGDDCITRVSVLTGKQMAAIASVALAGGRARSILSDVFRASSASTVQGGQIHFAPGKILHGTLLDNDRIVDEVVIGCEANDCFVVHCHGNPLLTQQVVKLFESKGAAWTDSEEFVLEQRRSTAADMIEAEAGLWMQKAATLTGVKIIANQVTAGLLPTVRKWLADFEQMTLAELWTGCHQVLRKSSRAKYLIHRCRIVLVGPPNSGKSSLLNYFAQKEQAVVAPVPGTTRDWVSVTCRLGPLLADIVDTAGLDETLAAGSEIDGMAQQTTLELIQSADMNIYVYDASKVRQGQSLLFNLGSLKAVIAANKCDLLMPTERQSLYSKYVAISAKTGEGIDRLVRTITAALKVDDFDCTAPVCFTDRQLAIIRKLIHTKEKEQARNLLSSLLYGEGRK
ncbi:MAG: GTP-binding protein [Planctomycetaceae bacterium]|nr:GTP-binding protein [Planctomycetaceae bacterium]